MPTNQPEILCFEWSADLQLHQEDDPICYMDGSQSRSHWQNKHFKTAQQAAWAFVRGHLKQPGEWNCYVTLQGGEPEFRAINVTETADGPLLRTDREDAAPAPRIANPPIHDDEVTK